MASMRSIGVRLRMFTGSYKQDTAEAGAATDKLGERIRKTGTKSQADFERIAFGAALVGTAMLAAATVAVVSWAKFDKQMSEVGAVSNATAGELKSLEQAALDAGAATSFSARQAAEAEAELAKAGISVADILGGALTGALDLAAAGSLELGMAATIAAAAMNTFKLEGKDVGHIADVLAAAANKSSAGVEDLGQGLQQVGLIAAQVDLSLDETVALLAAFADYGLKGSDGATSLKTALLRLAAPTDKAAETLDQYNISLYDANGAMLDAASVAGQLQNALKDLTPEQRNAALITIFGSDAIRAANVLYQEGEQGIREYTAAVNDEGAAARVAAAKLDNLAGDVEELTGSLETLFITSGSGANSGLRKLAQIATEVTNTIGAMNPVLLGTGTVLLGLGGGGLIAAAGLFRVKMMLAQMTPGLIGAYNGTGKLAAGFRFASVWGGRLLLTFAALAAAAEILEQTLDIKIPFLSDIISDSGTHALREYPGAVAKATRENVILTTSLEAQAKSGQELIDVWKLLNGAMVTADTEALQAVEAIAALTETFKENKFAVDRHTKAGLSNRVALESAAQEAIEAAAAYRDETGDVEGAAKMMEQYEKDALKAIGATGKQKDAVKALADELFRLPQTINTKINLEIAGIQAIRALELRSSRLYGGITEHADVGLLRDAAVYAPTYPARYGFAEPATGGEAFVPKRGNYGRSMGILSQAAGWYGADVVPKDGGGWYGGGGVINNYIEIGGEVVRVVHAEIKQNDRNTVRRVRQG